MICNKQGRWLQKKSRQWFCNPHFSVLHVRITFHSNWTFLVLPKDEYNMRYLQDVCNYTNAPEKEACKRHSIFWACTMLNIVSDINSFNCPLTYPPQFWCQSQVIVGPVSPKSCSLIGPEIKHSNQNLKNFEVKSVGTFPVIIVI